MGGHTESRENGPDTSGRAESATAEDDRNENEHPRSEPVTARAPAHVTAFFAPAHHDDPARAGATGGGLALTDGVTVTIERRESVSADATPPDRHRVTLNGERARIDAVLGVLTRLDTPPARVSVTSDVPIGAGFGVSGGAAVATAVAANERFELARTTNTLVGHAHAAEVTADTGLGDAVAIARGGVPLRLAPGDPTHGRLDGLPARPRIEYVSFGELSTPAVVSGDTTQVTRAGNDALDRVRETPTVTELIAAGRAFTDRVGLADDRVTTVLEAVERTGGHATMGMLGQTVVALDTGLSDAGYDPDVCGVDPTGVRLVENDP